MSAFDPNRTFCTARQFPDYCVILHRSADELKLEKGKTAYAIITATSVMVGVD